MRIAKPVRTLADLPPRMTKILEYYADAEERAHMSTRAECAEALGYAFPSAVTKHIEALVRKGLIVADRTKKRNVTLTDVGWQLLGRSPAQKGIPVIGAIAAGTPILAMENHHDYLTDLAPHAGRFALQVRGDSMIDAGINDGDFAIIDHGQPVRENQIAAVLVDQEATLKRVRYQKQGVTLIPENSSYEPIRLVGPEAASVSIVGPLVFVYRPFG